MSSAPVTLDFSTAKPISAPATPPPSSSSPGSGVSLDFSTAVPIGNGTTPPAPTPGGNTSPTGKSEGIYQMQSPDGRQTAIPYSKVKTAGPQGYRFSNQSELARYAKDHAADPVDETAIDKYLSNVPWWDMPGHALNLIMGAGTGVAKTAAGLDRAVRGNGPLTGPEEQLQLAAATPTKGTGQAAGEFGENIGEFFTGEELLGLAGKALQGSEKLKAATQIGQILEKHPTIAKLVKIGQNAVRQGTVAGAQTYAKTGGDTGAALKAGIETGGLGAGLETAGAVAAGAASKLIPAVSTGAEDYAAEARAAVKPHLENASRAVATAATEGARSTATKAAAALGSPELAAKAASLKVPQLDIDGILNHVHDFTGAADRLTDVNNNAYDVLDGLTGGKFRDLNTEVSNAQKAAFHGGPDQQKAYQESLKKMDALLNNTPGVSKDTLDAIKQSWKTSYQLRDVAGIWDRALNGVPGATKVSQTQRGINGNVLMNGLQRAVRDSGRANLEATLGPGRLDNLEQIARLNITNAQRQVFNRGVHEVARYLPIYLGARIGEHVGGFPGEVVGALAGGAVKPAIDTVLDAVKANPKIGQNLTFAIRSGADPKHFGPLIATMIQQANTEASRHDQDQNAGGTQ